VHSSSAVTGAAALRVPTGNLGYSTACTEIVVEMVPSALRFAKGAVDPLVGNLTCATMYCVAREMPSFRLEILTEWYTWMLGGARAPV
jgi:hypothetical protein